MRQSDANFDVLALIEGKERFVFRLQRQQPASP